MRLKNVCNYVHDAEIWKDHIRTEHQAGKKWPNKWGFTSVIYDRLEENLTGEQRRHSNFSNEMQKQNNTITQAKIFLKTENAKKVKNNRIILPPISQALPPSFTVNSKLLNKLQSSSSKERNFGICQNEPRKFPKSTSDEVGWLSKNFQPETYTQRARGKFTLYKKLGWPIESTM